MIKNTKKGFTLIELLVVIAIIGILSSVVVASMNSARLKSRDARRISDVSEVKKALEMYYDANDQQYPDALSSVVSAGLLPSMPTDPSTAAEYFYDNLTVSGAACVVADGGCVKYHLGANLESATDVGLTADADICAAAAAGCLTVLDGTTISGDDAGPCVAGGIGFCYDKNP